jgi:hypothetical protein
MASVPPKIYLLLSLVRQASVVNPAIATPPGAIPHTTGPIAAKIAATDPPPTAAKVSLAAAAPDNDDIAAPVDAVPNAPKIVVVTGAPPRALPFP